MKKDFEKHIRTAKERFIRFIKQNKIQWKLSDKDTVEIEDFVLAYEAMYNELSSQPSHPAQENIEKWYAVEYGGFWSIQTEDKYTDGTDVLNADDVGKEKAEGNAREIVETHNAVHQELTVKDFEDAIWQKRWGNYDSRFTVPSDFTEFSLHDAAKACYDLAQKLHSPPANSSGNLAAGVDWDAIEKEFLDYGIHSNVGDQKKIEIVNWFKSQLSK